jgi:hypothetical protein
MTKHFPQWMEVRLGCKMVGHVKVPQQVLATVASLWCCPVDPALAFHLSSDQLTVPQRNLQRFLGVLQCLEECLHIHCQQSKALGCLRKEEALPT